MSINYRDYSPMPGGRNWPNVTAPASCYADTIDECDFLRRVERLVDRGRDEADAIGIATMELQLSQMINRRAA